MNKNAAINNHAGIPSIGAQSKTVRTCPFANVSPATTVVATLYHAEQFFPLSWFAGILNCLVSDLFLGNHCPDS